MTSPLPCHVCLLELFGLSPTNRHHLSFLLTLCCFFFFFPQSLDALLQPGLVFFFLKEVLCPAVLGHLLLPRPTSLKRLSFRLSPQLACPRFCTHNLFSTSFHQNSFNGTGVLFKDFLCHCCLGFATAFCSPLFSWNVLFQAFLKLSPLDSLPDFPTALLRLPQSPLLPTLSF